MTAAQGCDKIRIVKATRNDAGPYAITPVVTDAQFDDLYSEFCDICERMWQHWPLDRDASDDPGGQCRHTSDRARAAASRICALVGIAPRAGRFATNGGEIVQSRPVRDLLAEARDILAETHAEGPRTLPEPPNA